MCAQLPVFELVLGPVVYGRRRLADIFLFGGFMVALDVDSMKDVWDKVTDGGEYDQMITFDMDLDGFLNDTLRSLVNYVCTFGFGGPDGKPFYPASRDCDLRPEVVVEYTRALVKQCVALIDCYADRSFSAETDAVLLALADVVRAPDYSSIGTFCSAPSDAEIPSVSERIEAGMVKHGFPADIAASAVSALSKGS